jgi:hypothetical protein
MTSSVITDRVMYRGVSACSEANSANQLVSSAAATTAATA